MTVTILNCLDQLDHAKGYMVTMYKRQILALIASQSADELLAVKTAKRASLGHIVAKNNYVDILSALIEKCPTIVHVLNDDSCTPIHFAVSYGRLESYELLLAAGADIFGVSSKGITLGDAALINGHISLFRRWFDDAFRLKDTVAAASGAVAATPDFFAALMFNVCIADGGYNDNNSMIDVIERIQSLFPDNPSAPLVMKNAKGFSPMFNAVRYASLDTVKYLLTETCEAMVPEDMARLLHYAVGHRRSDVAHFITDRYPPIEHLIERGVIHKVASGGDLELLIKLIGCVNIDCDTRDANGFTPAHIAAMYKRENILEYLHSIGHNMNNVSNAGEHMLTTSKRAYRDKGVSQTIVRELDTTRFSELLEK